MLAEERVLGVLVVASTDDEARVHRRGARAAADDRGRGGARARAPPLGRRRSPMRSSASRRSPQITRRITRRARSRTTSRGSRADELRRALRLDRTTIELAIERRRDGIRRSTRTASRIAIATVIERARSLARASSFWSRRWRDELGSSLQTAYLLEENRRRLEQQRALLHAAQVVTSELDLDACSSGSSRR